MGAAQSGARHAVRIGARPGGPGAPPCRHAARPLARATGSGSESGWAEAEAAGWLPTGGACPGRYSAPPEPVPGPALVGRSQLSVSSPCFRVNIAAVTLLVLLIPNNLHENRTSTARQRASTAYSPVDPHVLRSTPADSHPSRPGLQTSPLLTSRPSANHIACRRSAAALRRRLPRGRGANLLVGLEWRRVPLVLLQPASASGPGVRWSAACVRACLGSGTRPLTVCRAAGREGRAHTWGAMNEFLSR